MRPVQTYKQAQRCTSLKDCASGSNKTQPRPCVFDWFSDDPVQKYHEHAKRLGDESAARIKSCDVTAGVMCETAPRSWPLGAQYAHAKRRRAQIAPHEAINIRFTARVLTRVRNTVARSVHQYSRQTCGVVNLQSQLYCSLFTHQCNLRP